MMMFITMLMILFIIPTVIYLINIFFSMTKPMTFEKMTPYECGFSPMTLPNLPFSLPFYFITLLFLIFDIEIVLLLPIITYMNSLDSIMISLTMMFFLLLLIISLFIEIMSNLFKWA